MDPHDKPSSTVGRINGQRSKVFTILKQGRGSPGGSSPLEKMRDERQNTLKLVQVGQKYTIGKIQEGGSTGDVEDKRLSGDNIMLGDDQRQGERDNEREKPLTGDQLKAMLLLEKRKLERGQKKGTVEGIF